MTINAQRRAAGLKASERILDVRITREGRSSWLARLLCGLVRHPPVFADKPSFQNTVRYLVARGSKVTVDCECGQRAVVFEIRR